MEQRELHGYELTFTIADGFRLGVGMALGVLLVYLGVLTVASWG